MKFRFHKGGYEESMATCIDFNTLEELLSKIQEYYNVLIEKIECSSQGIDKRNDWDTYIVKATIYLGQEFVAGYLNRNL